jgi:hypothetical protein
MSSDLKFESLGNVGDTVDVLVLNARKDVPSMYYMSPWDIDLISHIYDVMPAMVNNAFRLLRNVYVVCNICNNVILFCCADAKVLREKGILYTKSARIMFSNVRRVMVSSGMFKS